MVLLLRSGSLPVREAISAVAEKLKAYGFVRIHRSHVVNVAFVTEIRPLASGEYLLRTRNDTTYTVSRTYKNNLRSIGDRYIALLVSGSREQGIRNADAVRMRSGERASERRRRSRLAAGCVVTAPTRFWPELKKPQ